MPVSLPTWARRSIHHDPLAIHVDASAVRLRVGIGRHLESYLQVTAGCVFTSQLGRPGFAGSLVAWPFEKKGGNVPHNRLSNSPCPRAPDSAQKARGIAQAVTFHGGARPLSRWVASAKHWQSWFIKQLRTNALPSLVAITGFSGIFLPPPTCGLTSPVQILKLEFLSHHYSRLFGTDS